MITLAKSYSHLCMVMQAMANVVKNADVGGLVERVIFMAHDLFGSLGHLCKCVSHSWSGQYCIRALEAQVQC